MEHGLSREVDAALVISSSSEDVFSFEKEDTRIVGWYQLPFLGSLGFLVFIDSRKR